MHTCPACAAVFNPHFVPCPQAVVGAQAPSSSSPPASDEEQALPSAFGEALTLTVRDGHPVQLSGRELADMTPAELAKHYKVRLALVYCLRAANTSCRGAVTCKWAPGAAVAPALRR